MARRSRTATLPAWDGQRPTLWLVDAARTAGYSTEGFMKVALAGRVEACRRDHDGLSQVAVYAASLAAYKPLRAPRGSRQASNQAQAFGRSDKPARRAKPKTRRLGPVTSVPVLLTDEASEVIVELAAALEQYGSAAAHANEIDRLLTTARAEVGQLTRSNGQARSIVAATASRHAVPSDVAAFLRRTGPPAEPQQGH